MSIVINQNAPSRGSATSPVNNSDVLRRLLEKAGLQKKATVSPSTSSGAPGSTTSVEQPETGTMQISQTSSPMAKTQPKAGTTYNGTYMQRGSFALGDGSVFIRWRQSPPIKGQKYPWRAQAISYEIYKDGKRLTGWRLNGLAYLDSNGKVHLPVRGPSGASRVFKSQQSFFSQDFKALVKALDKFRAERRYIEKHDWNNLPFAFRNKEGKIVATESTLLLGALIKKIGAKAIANSKKESRPFADRIHDNILRISVNKTMGGLVKRMLGATGLHLHDHPTRGRRLAEGSSSAASSPPKQYTKPKDIIDPAVAGAAVVWWDGINDILRDADLNRPPTTNAVNAAVAVIESALEGESNRTEYIQRLVTFFGQQRILFPRGLDAYDRGRLIALVGDLLDVAFDLRAGRGGQNQYRDAVDQLDGLLRSLRDRGRLGILPATFFWMLSRLPGFQETNSEFRDAARNEVQRGLEIHRAVYDILEPRRIPVDLIQRILTLAIVFISG